MELDTVTLNRLLDTLERLVDSNIRLTELLVGKGLPELRQQPEAVNSANPVLVPGKKQWPQLKRDLERKSKIDWAEEIKRMEATHPDPEILSGVNIPEGEEPEEQEQA